MQSMPNASEGAEAPLYVRWGPNGSPYAIELKLALVPTIRDLLSAVAGDSAEIGGVLIGSLPNSHSTTLRVEDVEMFARDEKNGSTFIIDPSQENKVEEVRTRVRATGRSVVGLLRSHRRPGALRPSLADRGLISSLFTEPVCVLLLIEGSEPHLAAFFVAQNGKMPAAPTVREFKFDDREFRLLPEVEPDAPKAPAPEPRSPKPDKRFSPLWIGLGGVLAASALYAVWQGVEGTKGVVFWRSNQLELATWREGPGLRVGWNNSSHALDGASGARLLVRRRGDADQTLQLGLDDLRLGAVEVENSASPVDVTLVVEVPGSSSITQTVRWENP
jgi:hypothetical protein